MASTVNEHTYTHTHIHTYTHTHIHTRAQARVQSRRRCCSEGCCRLNPEVSISALFSSWHSWKSSKPCSCKFGGLPRAQLFNGWQWLPRSSVSPFCTIQCGLVSSCLLWLHCTWGTGAGAGVATLLLLRCLAGILGFGSLLGFGGPLAALCFSQAPQLLYLVSGGRQGPPSLVRGSAPRRSCCRILRRRRPQLRRLALPPQLHRVPRS